MTEEEYRALAERIVRNVETRYVNDAGLVSADFPPTPRHLLADLDDYVPFLLWFGRADFVRRQIRASRRHLVDGMPATSGRVVSWRLDEYLGGLVSYHAYARCPDTLEMIHALLSGVRRHLVRRGHLISMRNTRSGITPPVIDPRSGALIEVILESELLADYREEALGWLQRFLEIDDFRREGLFPAKWYLRPRLANRISRWNPLPEPSRGLYAFMDGARALPADLLYLMPTAWKSPTTKHNTNLAHCLVTAFQATRDDRYRQALVRWHAAMRARIENGCVRSVVDARGHARRSKLANNFPVIDVLCDAHRTVEPDPAFLETAEAIARFWLSRRLPSGLFPETADATRSHLDDQTDMYVSLHRLHECTGNDTYRREAAELLPRIVEHHLVGGDLRVHADTRGSAEAGAVLPKFSALFLKALVHRLSGKTIYGDPATYQLMKDR